MELRSLRAGKGSNSTLWASWRRRPWRVRRAQRRPGLGRPDPPAGAGHVGPVGEDRTEWARIEEAFVQVASEFDDLPVTVHGPESGGGDGGQ